MMLVLGAVVAQSAFATGTLTFNTTIQGDGKNNGRNDVRLNSVTKNGVTYSSFTGPKSVTVNAPHPNHAVRVVQGPNGVFPKDVSVLADRNSGALENSSTFNISATKAMQDTRNLNRFIDISGNVNVTTTLDFSDSPFFAQFLWTERGTGGSNSFAVLTAVDANGNRINGSKQYLIRPEDAVKTGIEGAIYEVGSNPKFCGTQHISGQLIDIKSAFGLDRVTRVTVSVPVANGQYGNARFSGLGHGQDFQPDFRLVGAVPEPASMIAMGLGVAGLLRRKAKKNA